MSNVDMNASLEEQLKRELEGGAPEKMDIEGAPAPKKVESDAEKEQKKKEREQKAKEREQKEAAQANQILGFAKRSGANYIRNDRFVQNNQQYGRFLGFFTATDPVVKVSLKQTPINSGTPQAPKFTLRPGVTLDADLKAKFADGTKNIGSKYLECKTDVVFRQAGPSTVVAGIVKTPAMTEITSLQQLETMQEWNSDCVSDKTTVLKVLPKEALYSYLELNYDKKISEDESIPGATELIVRSTEVKSKDGKGTGANQVSYRTRIVASGRSLFTKGNYFPLETYDTVNVHAASEEEKVLANNNFGALLKQYNAAPRQNANGQVAPAKGEFSEEAKALFKKDDANSNDAIKSYACTSSIVNAGAAISCKTFDAKGKNPEMMVVNELPVREIAPSKDGKPVRYVYRKSKFNEGVNPAITRTEYQAFIQRVTAAGDNIDFEQIAAKAKKTSKTASRSRAKTVTASDRISGIDMIALRSNANVSVDNHAGKIEDIFAMFSQAAV